MLAPTLPMILGDRRYDSFENEVQDFVFAVAQFVFVFLGKRLEQVEDHVSDLASRFIHRWRAGDEIELQRMDEVVAVLNPGLRLERGFVHERQRADADDLSRRLIAVTTGFSVRNHAVSLSIQRERSS